MNLEDLYLPQDTRENKKAYHYAKQWVRDHLFEIAPEDMHRILHHPDVDNITKNLDEDLMDYYLYSGVACPIAIKLSGNYTRIDDYLDLIVPNSVMSEYYLSADLKNYQPFHNKLMQYCVEHKRLQLGRFKCSDMTDYVNLYTRKDPILMHYINDAMNQKIKVNFHQLNPNTQALIVALRPQAIFSMPEAVQMTLLPELNPFEVSPQSMSEAVRDVYFDLCLKKIDSAPDSLLCYSPELLEFLIEREPSKMREIFARSSTITVQHDYQTFAEYEANQLQFCLYNQHATDHLELALKIFPELLIEPLVQKAGAFSFARDFAEVLMQHEKYEVFEYMPESRARGCAALYMVNSKQIAPWVTQSLGQANPDDLAEWSRQLPGTQEFVAPIIEKLRIQPEINVINKSDKLQTFKL